MKKLFLVSMMILTSIGAFAYPHPGPHRGPYPGPYPRPMPYPRHPYPGPVPYPRPVPYPSPMCQAAAIDTYNRVIAYFPGNAPMCRDALDRCNFQVQRQGWWGARCVILGNRW